MQPLHVTIDGMTFEIEVSAARRPGDPITVKVDGEELQVLTLPGPEHQGWMIIDGRPYEVTLDPHLRWIQNGGFHDLAIESAAPGHARPASADGRIKAPIPGLITHIFVEQGQTVARGQPLLVLEAMKMENEIRAPRDGTLIALHVHPGQEVAQHTPLAEVG